MEWRRKNMIISIDAEENIGQNPTGHLWFKKLQQTRNRWKLPQTNKEHLRKSTANIALNSQVLNGAPPAAENKAGAAPSHVFSKLELLVRKEDEEESARRKEEVKLSRRLDPEFL